MHFADKPKKPPAKLPTKNRLTKTSNCIFRKMNLLLQSEFDSQQDMDNWHRQIADQAGQNETDSVQVNW